MAMIRKPPIIHWISPFYGDSNQIPSFATQHPVGQVGVGDLRAFVLALLGVGGGFGGLGFKGLGFGD